MNPHLTRKIRKVLAPIRRIGLKNTDFSIISNNCWGGVLYDIFGLKYRTPTVGLYFFSDDFIKFITNLDYYLSLEARPLALNDSNHKKELIEKGDAQCPLGIIDDIEIVFAHYPNQRVALDKWNYRKKRINFNNLLIKFNDQNSFHQNNYIEFTQLAYTNKVFFTSNRKYLTMDYCYFIKQFENIGYAVDDIAYTKKKVNIKKLLNNMTKCS